MLKVMLLSDRNDNAACLRRALAAAGVRVAAERTARAGPDLAGAIALTGPDAVLTDASAAARGTLEDICAASESSARPVVVFAEDGSRAAMRAALQAGVAGYVVGLVPPERIPSLLEVAIERGAIERTRRVELADARRRLADRQIVEQAKELLMQRDGLSEEQAHRLLRLRAMQSQRRLGEVARALVNGAHGAPGGRVALVAESS